MKRENGFYWVRWADKWEVAEWTGGQWLLCGFSTDLHTQDFELQQIDENRIINPNE